MFLLRPISPDPEPSEECLAPLRREEYGDMADEFARMLWETQLKKKNPNAFIVRFATEVLNYEDYLESNKWRRIRRKILKAHEQCAACFSKATQVHHRDYRPRVLDGDDLDALVPLCKTCHDRIHSDGKRRRNTWEEVESVLKEIIAAKNCILDSN